ncbi:hypothetical protein MMC07_001696 [Pseudocyphellaria aurata]|nr:hypothetical protein [Pseudocyphellaria aurata]
MALSLHRTVDLDQVNNFDAPERLSVFLTSRRMHEEAYHVFYGGHTFRIFPTHWRFFGHKSQSVLSRLPTRYRKALVSLELRLGPGWSNPPTSWRVTDRLALEDMSAVRKLMVFMECDPSHDIFRGFRPARDFFTNFAGNILKEIVCRLPSLEAVQFDGYPSVSRDGPLMKRLTDEVKRSEKKITWGSDISLRSSPQTFEDLHDDSYLSKD